MTTPATVAFESITELAASIRAGAVSPVDLAQRMLERIDKLNPRLHAFIAVTAERALAEAEATARALKGGSLRGPLHGIPYAVKDLYDVAGVATTAGTRLLADRVMPADCAVVGRLAAAGMTLLGKTYTVQFAFGGVGVNHDQGTPHNPWHVTAHAPGGSSSGTAVAVAAGLVPMALGSDTGGSVRIPAALCGVVGLKTTVGRVSRAGVYPLSWTLDSVGPLTRSVEDAALVYQILQGADLADPTTCAVPPHDVVTGLKDGVRGLRLAFGETVFFDDVDPTVGQAVRATEQVFRSLGAHVDRIALPEAQETMAERKRALTIAAEACTVNATLLDNHFDALDPVVAHRMIAGRTLAATDYAAILRRWHDLRERVHRRLRHVDALLVPTTPLPARPLSEVDASAEAYAEYNARYLRNTAIGNLLNLCAVALPCGFTDDGSPLSLMIYAKPFEEDTALRVAYAYEQATTWHTRHPDLSWIST